MSILTKFILENNNWRELLEEKNIVVKNEDNYYIFNYDIGADFSDPVVQECRGIILNDKFEVVCYPFRKFGNYDEPYADKIDWSTARVQSKLDGSIIKLWYDNDWHWSTNGQITMDSHFYNLMINCVNYTMIDFDNLDRDYTYIFELTSPDNQIVVRYPYSKLYHIGTRNNITGIEENMDIGIEKPMRYSLSTLDDCIKAVKELNKTNAVDYEGFVVVDGNWNRVKIKSPEYFMWHRLINNYSFKKDHYIDMIINNSDLINGFCDNFPTLIHVLKYYEWQYSEFLYQANKFVEYSKNVYAEYNYDRKLLANAIKNNKFSSIAFKCIDRNIDATQYIQELPLRTIIKYIEEYRND